MNPRRAGLLELHLAVLLFGISGLFGKFLAISPLLIVLGRSGFASLTLAGVLLVHRESRAPLRKSLTWVIVSGIVLSLHWICFFQAIQVSSVAVGLLTFSSFPLFVTLLEPVIFRERMRPVDLVTAILVLAGLAFIVPRFDLNNRVTQGAMWGIASGFLFAVLSLLNRRFVAIHSPVFVAFGQNLVAALILLALLPTYKQPITLRDGVLLLILGVFCTALSHVLFIQSLKHVRAQLASVVSGLEAVYGILLAALFLHEIPASRTLVGGALILLAVMIGTMKRKGGGSEGMMLSL